MPELPEVEILARELRRYIVGRRVTSVDTVPNQRLEAGHERLPESRDDTTRARGSGPARPTA